MGGPLDLWSAIADELAKLADDPAERIRVIARVRSHLSNVDDLLAVDLRSAILQLREQRPRWTWAEIGDLLGVSASRAEQLSR